MWKKTMGIVASRVYSIGMKLSSFIDTEDELDIMSCLYHIAEELPTDISVKLWYNEGEIKKGEKVLIPEELSDFPNYESPLSPINPESEDRIHRIIYCVSQLKDSK